MVRGEIADGTDGSGSQKKLLALAHLLLVGIVVIVVGLLLVLVVLVVLVLVIGAFGLVRAFRVAGVLLARAVPTVLARAVPTVLRRTIDIVLVPSSRVVAVFVVALPVEPRPVVSVLVEAVRVVALGVVPVPMGAGSVVSVFVVTAPVVPVLVETAPVVAVLVIPVPAVPATVESGPVVPVRVVSVLVVAVFMGTGAVIPVFVVPASAVAVFVVPRSVVPVLVVPLPAVPVPIESVLVEAVLVVPVLVVVARFARLAITLARAAGISSAGAVVALHGSAATTCALPVTIRTSRGVLRRSSQWRRCRPRRAIGILLKWRLIRISWPGWSRGGRAPSCLTRTGRTVGGIAWHRAPSRLARGLLTRRPLRRTRRLLQADLVCLQPRVDIFDEIAEVAAALPGDSQRVIDRDVHPVLRNALRKVVSGHQASYVVSARDPRPAAPHLL
ncbi:hypothetical protein C8258_11310 [Nocardia sp. MDA0666]|nr:hypothetical protein C8258_11310 [Nocardia sp. MDA0666]